jgi:hypothetical protein
MIEKYYLVHKLLILLWYSDQAQINDDDDTNTNTNINTNTNTKNYFIVGLITPIAIFIILILILTSHVETKST